MTRYVPPVPSPVPEGEAIRRKPTAQVSMRLASRLTNRDRQVLRALWDHYVLTTGQIAQLAYPNPDRARRGMLRLTGLGAVERFRPLLPPGQGTAPLHYTLGLAGAHAVAADLGIPFADLGYRRDRLLAWALSRQLNHLLGVNGIFTSLIAAARHLASAELAEWWPQRRCATTWEPYIRPDGFGRWIQDGTSVDFFLEYDTGTQRPLKRVSGKLRGYADLAAADGFTTPILIWTSSPRREANLHAAMGTPPVPVFTTTADAINDPSLGPAGPVWLPVGPHNGQGTRLSLAALASHANPVPLTEDDDDQP